MKKISTLLLLLLYHFCFSQNLVPNPSFEQYDTCPYNLDQVRFATGWSVYRESPDYFNTCAVGNQFVDIPSNNFGLQYPKSGDAYIGMYTYNDIDNYREYVGIELTQPLVIGQKYYASFYVSRAVRTGSFDINIANNKIGMRLSTVAYSYSNPAPTDDYAQVFSDSIITDTLNWTEIEGSFIADSAYNYLSIGNFFTDSLTSIIKFDSTSLLAYYYIDDIFLSADSVEGINEYSFASTKIFPNPARDWISVWGNDIQSLMLSDVLGRIVYTSNSEFISPVQINVSSFSRGTYLLKIETKIKSINQKIILE